MGVNPLRTLVFGIRDVYENGVKKTFAPAINFIGATVGYDANNKRIDVTVTGSGAAVGDTLPESLGTPSAGVGATASRIDHVHAHGDQGGGDDHALATGSAHGFMSKTDKDKLDGIDANILNAQRAWKPPARCIAPANIPDIASASFGDFEGDVEVGDRVLLPNQTNAEERLVYLVVDTSDGVILAVASDFDSDADLVLGMTVQVLEGASAGVWRLESPTSGTLQYGVTGLVWRNISGTELRDFSSFLTLDRNVYMIHDGDGSARLTLDIDAAATPVAGTATEILIPAGSLLNGDKDGIATNLNADAWPSIDPDVDAKVVLVVESVSPLRVSSSYENLGLRDATAPTIVSATVDGSDPDALVVVFDEAMTLKSIAGLSLDFTVGTPRTITGMPSGIDSDTLTFPLSGNVAETDEFSFDFAGHTLQDKNGNALADGSEPVSVEGFTPVWTMAGELHMYRGDDMSTTGSGPTLVTSVTDQTGAAPAVSSTNKPEVANISATREGWKITNTSSAKLEADVTAEVMTSGAIAIVADTVSLANFVLVTGVAAASVEVLVGKIGANMIGRRNATDNTNAYASGLIDILFTWTGSDAELYIDGSLVDSDTTDEVIANMERWAIGGYDDTSLCPDDTIFGEVRISNQHLVAGDATAFHAYRTAYYV